MEMLSYLSIPLGIAAGLITAFCTRRQEGISYTLLDKISIAFNFALIPGYLILSLMIAFIGMIPTPEHSGFLGIIGWIGAILIAAGPIGIGFSVGASTALRRKGKSLGGFLIQFAGFAFFALSLLLFVIFDETGLLDCSLN